MEEYQSTNRVNINTDPRTPRELARGSAVITAASFSAETTGFSGSVSITLDNIIFENVIPDVRFVHFIDLSPPAGSEQYRHGPYTRIDTNGNVLVSLRSTIVNQTVALPGKTAQGLVLTFTYYARVNTPSSSRDTANYDQTINYVLYSNDLVRLT